MSNICGKSAVVAGLICTLFFANVAFAHHQNRDHHDDHQVCKTEVVSTSVSGPENYHDTYAAITQTNVTIQDYILRLENGGTITVKTDPMAVNLQNLIALTLGLPLDLRQVEFPDGETIQVAEIGTNIS